MSLIYSNPDWRHAPRADRIAYARALLVAWYVEEGLRPGAGSGDAGALSAARSGGNVARAGGEGGAFVPHARGIVPSEARGTAAANVSHRQMTVGPDGRGGGGAGHSDGAVPQLDSSSLATDAARSAIRREFTAW